jgi:hypothetical protein
MVFGQLDEMGGRCGRIRREDLRMDMVADLLDSDFVESRPAGLCNVRLVVIKQSRRQHTQQCV